MLKACASLVPGFSAELADQQKRDQQAVDRQRFEQAHGDDHVRADGAGGLGLARDGVHGVGGGKTLADAGADGADGDGERGGDRNDSG